MSVVSSSIPQNTSSKETETSPLLKAMLNGIEKKLTQLPEYQYLIESELDIEHVSNTANRFSRAFALFEYGEEGVEFLDRSAKSLVTNVSTEPELSKIESLLQPIHLIDELYSHSCFSPNTKLPINQGLETPANSNSWVGVTELLTAKSFTLLNLAQQLLVSYIEQYQQIETDVSTPEQDAKLKPILWLLLYLIRQMNSGLLLITQYHQPLFHPIYRKNGVKEQKSLTGDAHKNWTKFAPQRLFMSLMLAEHLNSKKIEIVSQSPESYKAQTEFYHQYIGLTFPTKEVQDWDYKKDEYTNVSYQTVLDVTQEATLSSSSLSRQFATANQLPELDHTLNEERTGHYYGIEDLLRRWKSQMWRSRLMQKQDEAVISFTDTITSLSPATDNFAELASNITGLLQQKGMIKKELSAEEASDAVISIVNTIDDSIITDLGIHSITDDTLWQLLLIDFRGYLTIYAQRGDQLLTSAQLAALAYVCIEEAMREAMSRHQNLTKNTNWQVGDYEELFLWIIKARELYQLALDETTLDVHWKRNQPQSEQQSYYQQQVWFIRDTWSAWLQEQPDLAYSNTELHKKLLDLLSSKFNNPKLKCYGQSRIKKILEAYYSEQRDRAWELFCYLFRENEAYNNDKPESLEILCQTIYSLLEEEYQVEKPATAIISIEQIKKAIIKRHSDEQLELVTDIFAEHHYPELQWANSVLSDTSKHNDENVTKANLFARPSQVSSRIEQVMDTAKATLALDKLIPVEIRDKKVTKPSIKNLIKDFYQLEQTTFVKRQIISGNTDSKKISAKLGTQFKIDKPLMKSFVLKDIKALVK